MTEVIVPLPSSPPSRVPLAEIRLIARRIVNAVVTLLVIAYLTSFVLILAERGRDGLPAKPLEAVAESFIRLGNYIAGHPQTYFWHKANMPAGGLVLDTLGISAGLLFISLGVALILGVTLGITAAISKSKLLSTFIVLLSTLGVSTPSFLLGMLFWVINIQVHRTFDIKVLPAGGFGWDLHLIMPVLTLAMRPLAQVAQVSYVSLTDIYRNDFIRTAYSKGLPSRLVTMRHALTNALIPILTTLGTSLRFSLASLPVVELFFAWPGVGLTLLQAVDKGMSTFVIDLILSLGMFFLLVNLVIEILFPLIDARLRNNTEETSTEEKTTLGGSFKAFFHALRELPGSLIGMFKHETNKLPALPAIKNKLEDPEKAISQHKWVLRAFFRNPALIFGILLVLGLTGLALWGGKFSQANPYATHGVMTIEGKIWAPPFKPSSVFPWGSDYIGRDIQSLVLNGARQTLSLALFGMLARIILGVFLGTLAGWKRGSQLDRLVSGMIGVWAAFPVTLFAMLLIQSLGIQQGMWVFVLTISVVGWGEVAQIVRSQVINIKLQPYIESARSVGARSIQILIRHVLPNLINSLIVMAALEMGGIMMLLAELGYLNIFLGGGFRAMIGEVGRMQPLIVSFSDVPEWAALIANVRAWWRSYPWMALYPGLGFFFSIMAFNLAGEGLRRFLDESRLNLSRLFNRYTLMAGTAAVIILSVILQANAPLGTYKPEGLKFDAQRVMQDIKVLVSPEFRGRETGSEGANLAADYIAKRMQENGLMPAGEKLTYQQVLIKARRHLLSIPTLEIVGDTSAPLVYRRDFAEIAGARLYGERQASIVGIVLGETSNDDKKPDPYSLLNTDSRDRILVVRGEDYSKVRYGTALGLLVIADDQHTIERKDLIPDEAPVSNWGIGMPTMVISPQLAEKILGTARSSIADLNKRAIGLGVNQVSLTEPGATVHMKVDVTQIEYGEVSTEEYINILGVIPGEGHFMGTESQVVVVSAYYDGLGVGPDGTFYPGANDNASGVATLLELARLLSSSIYKPEKTVLFAVWAGGERREGLSVVNIMNARPGADSLTVEAVIELSGVGEGSGKAIALADTSSYRLTKLFQSAAKKYADATTTRGRNPHYGYESAPGFGDRRAMTLSISWDGSDYLAHTPQDTPDIIDPQKLTRVGRSTLLTLMVLSREQDY